MAGETRLTYVGRLAADVESGETNGGVHWARFRVLSNARRMNQQTQRWEDEPATAFDVKVWRELADYVADSFMKGSLVIVVGVLKTDTWEDRQTGQKRSKQYLEAEEVGASVRFGAIRYVDGSDQRTLPSQQAQADPWGQQGGIPAPAPQSDVWGAPGASYNDGQPF